MSIIVQETADSGSGSEGSGETRRLRYEIFRKRGDGTAEPFGYQEARTALLNQTPMAIGSSEGDDPLFRSQVSIDFEDAYYAKASVEYAPINPNITPGEPNRDYYSFGVTAEATNIKYGYETVSQHVSSGDPVTFGGAINVDDRGDAQGVDVATPRLQWTITRYFALDVITPEWIKNAAGIVGTINNSTFRTFASGELMLISLTGAPNWQDKQWEINYAFDASPNIEDMTIGHGGYVISGVNKRGFDYLWIKSQNIEIEKAGGEKVLIPVALQANVERVYQYRDFSELGI
jgi:hypothetical protein